MPRNAEPVVPPALLVADMVALAPPVPEPVEPPVLLVADIVALAPLDELPELLLELPVEPPALLVADMVALAPPDELLLAGHGANVWVVDAGVAPWARDAN